uniref:Uncharacterized protein n=1 Tax=Panagrolaimus sp. JU765 TaxID=591449 RepID=A0AC34QZ73_9BILA
MQSHAAAMAKKASKTSLASTLSEGDVPEEFGEITHQRRPSLESTHSMPPIISGTIGQNFTQAAALASQPRHERYAAHLPIRQTSLDGRQSTTSQDSNNSVGVLDTASKQLDQMIDQARYKHHQHRSKFKEAIDYLDQIFEDLKKEVEPTTPANVQTTQKNMPIPNEKKIEPNPTIPQKNVTNSKSVFQKQVQQPQIQIPTQTTNVPIVRLRKPSDLIRQQQQQQQQQPIRSMNSNQNGQTKTTTTGPINIIKPLPIQQPIRIAQPSTSMPKNNQNFGPKPFPKLETTSDVEISETIVLPQKQNSEKMDFTRQWLSGDIKSWVEKPLEAVNTGDLTSPNDSDDRSIGSCSAEVAAINAADRRKKRKDNQEINKTTTKSNGIVEPTLHKVPSHEFISSLQKAQNDRAGSQLALHNDLQKLSRQILHSRNLNRSGAFQQYPQRGSTSSLFDGQVNGNSSRYQQPIQDPVLAIDALVAELELNTEQERGKRLSFPQIVDGSTKSENANYRGGIQRPVPNRIGLQNEKINGGSIDRGLRRLQQQQKSNLDEMANMLTNVAGDLTTNKSTQSPQKILTNSQIRPTPRKFAIKSENGKLDLSPFETINSEKIAPSRVGAIQQIFENKKNNNGSK